MSAKHVRTAADLARFGCGLKIECGACGASRTLDGFEVARMVGSGPLAGLKPRLRCGSVRDDGSEADRATADREAVTGCGWPDGGSDGPP